MEENKMRKQLWVREIGGKPCDKKPREGVTELCPSPSHVARCRLTFRTISQQVFLNTTARAERRLLPLEQQREFQQLLLPCRPLRR